MVKYLSNRIADLYIKRNIIQPDEKEVYKCGLELILNDIVTFTIVIFISGLVFKVRYAFEFLITFCVVRVYCGGYHAAKTYICRLTMLVTFLSVVILSELMVRLSDYPFYLIIIISLMVLLPLIPVKHPNKKLTDTMIAKNRRNGIIAYIVFSFCGVILLNFISRQDAYIIAISLSAVTALAIIGILVNERRKKQWKV